MKELLKAMAPMSNAKEIEKHRDVLLDSIQHGALCTSGRCYCEFERRRKSVERLCDLAMRGNERTYGAHELLRKIRSWLWLHHPTSRQWEGASRTFAKEIDAILGDR